ncbi:hypothetical protein L3Q82_020119 [Scortum barcoo]|uniref:Uncharacterized protein n=1 Tax=Scortum barcoo TaxID=214431 RepID=A0ACB8VDS3_9TELE|nr:hypothetical protein L3Q82_020119 [Scortum barcoo]
MPIINVLENTTATLPCPHKSGDVSWSRLINSKMVILVSIVNGQEKKNDKRYSSLVDNSLVIINVKISDSAVFWCNKSKIYLNVTNDPNMVPIAGNGPVTSRNEPRNTPRNEPVTPRNGPVTSRNPGPEKRVELNTKPDKTAVEVIYEEIEAGEEQRESDVESPYYWSSITESPVISTPPKNNLYSTVNKSKSEGRSTEPPKTKNKKAGKAKSSAVVDGLSTEEMSKDQLEEHIVRLREELDREREERSYFQLERDKIQAFWEISKRNLEEAKAELRNKQREREEAEQRHRVEITVYKQKLKHVLSEHHSTISELKMDGVASTSLVREQHTQSALGLLRARHGLQADLREKKLQNENCIKELKLKHQVELMELANGYDRRIREIEVKYHKKMQSMIEAEGKKRRAEIDELEDKMKSRVATLVEDHDRALRGAEEYYSAIQSKLLVDQTVLKEELAEAMKQQAQVDKELSAAEQENKRLRESLQEAERKQPELQKQLEDYKQAKTKMAMSSARAKVIEKGLRDLTVQHELLLQAFEKVQQERDELLKKQTEAILDVQQRSGLKELLLEKKLAALTEMVEKKEAQLCAALSASNADQTAGSSAANKLQEILESKQVTISALQSDLARESKEYDDLLRTCGEGLAALGVPLYDFPFRPSDQILGGPGSER